MNKPSPKADALRALREANAKAHAKPNRHEPATVDLGALVADATARVATSQARKAERKTAKHKLASP